eukprot:TRINITY_DN56469_c0_g1_i1.p2 TRINITY_DN56469_c0_g1~~TRINITY_DN56469_c0_g1_i1.p2  ORF type:complete len:209 (-),score=24.01 TRINITY_DN56469_c0_g1_i1:44-637(-)
MPPKNIAWTGWYEQGGNKNDVSFENMTLTFDGKLAGSGSDGVGAFTIEGHLQGNMVMFEKKYGGHSVTYKGTLSGDTINGTWEIPGNCNGTFEINMTSNTWSGWYTMGDSNDQNDVKVELTENDNHVYGLGTDGVGNFQIAGAICPHTQTVRFTKKYFGAHEVHYTGIVSSQNGNRTYIGHWHIPGNCHGRFSLTKN